MEEVKTAFDALAGEYDSQRRWIIPEIEAFYGAAVWSAEWEGKEPDVLDVGAGTGLLSELLLNRYPGARMTLLDISEKMLEVARTRFAGKEHVRYFVADYSREEIPGRYDLICSALSIHHLTNEDKQRLFSRIFRSLNPGGVFVNADQADAESDWLRKMNLEYWNNFVRSGPLPDEEWRQVLARRDVLDRNAPLLSQIAWLKDAGFSGVDIVYKNRMFCVFVGKKE
ncbi:MAG: class I SAM-dependent methyltransferase [Methanolinea sp.]|nr:class I SAM-dependent methyltransferase [Methanolinea sp.]